MYYVNIAAAIGFVVLAIVENRKGSFSVAAYNTAGAIANVGAVIAFAAV